MFDRILSWAGKGEIVFSNHGYGEAAADGIMAKDILAGARDAKIVEAEWLDSETGWPPYLSLQDAQRLDAVREALRLGDLGRAVQPARIYQLTPL